MTVLIGWVSALAGALVIRGLIRHQESSRRAALQPVPVRSRRGRR